MNNIRIITVCEEDADFLYELMNNESVLAALNEVPTTKSVWSEAITEWNHDPDEEDYIIYDGAVPVGWIGINGLSSKDKKAYLKMIVLLPQCQNIGIGQYAINKIAESLKQQGICSIGLYTDKSNIQAQHCYLKCGFHIINELEQKMSNGLIVKRCEMESLF